MLKIKGDLQSYKPRKFYSLKNAPNNYLLSSYSMLSIVLGARDIWISTNGISDHAFLSQDV